MIETDIIIYWCQFYFCYKKYSEKEIDNIIKNEYHTNRLKIKGGYDMISFKNDYSEGAHNIILERIQKENSIQNIGYGEDEHCKKAAECIQKQLDCYDCDVYFLVGGTQTNLVMISHCLKPYQAVIAADSGHINVHETGAIEATGHKVIAMSSKEGKLDVQAVQKALDIHTDEHMVQPKMVYVSNPTEVGTLYTKKELESLSDFCKQHHLIFYLDGARMASALASKYNDITITDYSKLVDLLYLGGTKCGALFGEALVIFKRELNEDFRFSMKQKGAMLAKGWLLGIQFETLFEGELYQKTGEHANAMAEKIKNAIEQKGYSFQFTPCSNQLFPILPNTVLQKLEKEFLFTDWEKIDNNHTSVRIVTSWATKEENVQKLIKQIEQA